MSAIEHPETQFEQTETARIVSERPRIETICLVFISLVAAVFLLRYAQAIFLPFVLALLLFYALDPVVSWISCFGISRIVSCLLLILAFLGTSASGAYLLRGQASDLVNRLPEAMVKAKAFLVGTAHALGLADEPGLDPHRDGLHEELFRPIRQ